MKLLYISFTILFISFFFLNTITASQATCLASCSGSDGTCCGCCDSSAGQTCHQIPEQATCCSAGESFCGCLSARASCIGNVWGESLTVNEAFGLCYNPANYGECLYVPTANVFELCSTFAPKACFSYAYSNAMPVCCGAQDTCGFDTVNYKNTCIPPPAPVTCGTATCYVQGDQCCEDKVSGYRCYDPTRYTCASNGLGGQSLCPSGTRACGNACYDPSLYCCSSSSNGLMQRQFCAPGAM